MRLGRDEHTKARLVDLMISGMRDDGRRDRRLVAGVASNTNERLVGVWVSFIILRRHVRIFVYVV